MGARSTASCEDSSNATQGTPATNSTSAQQHLRNQSTGTGSIASTLNSVGTGHSFGKYAVSNGVTSNGGATDGLRPHTETGSREVGSPKRTSFIPKTARVEPVREKRKPRMSDSDNDASRSPREAYDVQGTQPGVRHATVDGTADGEETELARKLREGGIVDLRNTTDTDGDMTWAPGMLFSLSTPLSCSWSLQSPFYMSYRH